MNQQGGVTEIPLAEIRALFNAGAVTAEQRRMFEHWKARTNEDMAYRLAYYAFADDRVYQKLKRLVGAA